MVEEIKLNVVPWNETVSLQLSGACQVDVAVSTSSRHADLSNARRLAVARPKLRGRRSSSTVLSHDCLGLPTLRRQSLGGPRMHDWRAREWSWLGSARLRCPKKDRWRPWIVSDKNGCPVGDRTSSFETKSVQWIRRIHLRPWGTSYQAHQSSSIAKRLQTIPQIHRGMAENRHYTAGAWFPARLKNSRYSGPEQTWSHG